MDFGAGMSKTLFKSIGRGTPARRGVGGCATRSAAPISWAGAQKIDEGLLVLVRWEIDDLPGPGHVHAREVAGEAIL